MKQDDDSLELRLDRPLQTASALKTDTLNREPFARRVCEVLSRISPETGLVASIEGSWGCGKTSLLAIVEALLITEPEKNRPLIVHFNPWLIGDRDALLRQFLASVAKAVKLTDHVKEGKKVAKELKTYAKAFDILKLIPGAEPWASMVKVVIESVGNASEAVFDYKTPDIEAHKHSLEQALRKFPRRIVVFVDDLDRLYPAEVYEMVRIIKAVGELPNVGYLLAWDEKFVSSALKKLNVPFASMYLDKVVQVRLSVPPLSFEQRVDQMNSGLARLAEAAHNTYFSNSDSRQGLLFHHGLSELMEHPRDVVRLFDVVASIEPELRGEIHLADIIGLAAVMNKAPLVFDLIRRTPQAFIGRRPGTQLPFQDPKEVIKALASERNDAIDASNNPKAVRDLIQFLFPSTSEKDKHFVRAKFIEGHIAHPNRMSVALQLCAGAVDISLVKVRRFLFNPLDRRIIADELNDRNCAPFLDCLGSLLEELEEDIILDWQPLALELARMIDLPCFVKRARERADVWLLPANRSALRAIEFLAKRMTPETVAATAEMIVCDPFSLSAAFQIAYRSYAKGIEDEDVKSEFLAIPDSRDRILTKLARNLELAAASGELFEKNDPGQILHSASLLIPAHCKLIFKASQLIDPKSDNLVLALLEAGFDTNKGQYYNIPKDLNIVEQYVSIDALKTLAADRLKDKLLIFPFRAAWLAIERGQAIYGKDGSSVER